MKKRMADLQHLTSFSLLTSEAHFMLVVIWKSVNTHATYSHLNSHVRPNSFFKSLSWEAFPLLFFLFLCFFLFSPVPAVLEVAQVWRKCSLSLLWTLPLLKNMTLAFWLFFLASSDYFPSPWSMVCMGLILTAEDPHVLRFLCCSGDGYDQQWKGIGWTTGLMGTKLRGYWWSCHHGQPIVGGAKFYPSKGE